MSTRSVTRLIGAETKQVYLSMYVHCDGYPEAPHGMGWRLSQFLEGVHTVHHGQNEGKRYNTVGEVAAGLLAHFWTGARKEGGLVILNPHGCDAGEQYNYDVYMSEDMPTRAAEIHINGQKIGTVPQLRDYCQHRRGEEE